MGERVTLYEAMQAFMGRIVAEYGRLVEDGPDHMPVFITFGSKDGGHCVELTLADLKRLDRAYAQAFDQKCRRDERKAKGTLL